MAMLPYFSSIVAFVAGIIALTSKSWDDSVPGKLKFTKRGWMSLVAVILGFSLTLASTYKTARDNDLNAKQHRMVRQLACDELAYLCRKAASPFDVMLSEKAEGLGYRGVSPTETWRPSLTGTAVIRELVATDLLENPGTDISGFEYDTYTAALKTAGDNLPAEFHKIFMDYSAYLEPEDILLIYKIKDSFYLKALASFQNSYPSSSHLNWFDNDDDNVKHHIDFFKSLEELWTRVDPSIHFQKQ